jgi:gliding motility-associated-like protein
MVFHCSRFLIVNMIKEIVKYILIFTISLGLQNLYSQTAFHNIGNVQIHDGGEIGFHSDVINDGTFDQNLGLVGFYNNINPINVSGLNKPVFNNVDVDVTNNLILNTSIGVKNDLSFIAGNVITPRNNVQVSLEFININVYSGEGNYELVDGYVSTKNSGEFTFPIGDADALRPMIIPNQVSNSTFKGAYFKENPNSPSTFSQNFDTSNKQQLLEKINDVEFWDLNGSTETDIVLTWDANSNIGALTSDIENLRVVGWDKITNKWVDLGGEKINGTLDEGSITSKLFVPNTIEILTIGTDVRELLGITTTSNHNFGMSPNGDGFNDNLIIEGIELRGNNTLKVYNRYGALVFSEQNYNNTWNGDSQNTLTINKNVGLPDGTYFYSLEFHDEQIIWQGYIYLVR